MKHLLPASRAAGSNTQGEIKRVIPGILSGRLLRAMVPDAKNEQEMTGRSVWLAATATDLDAGYFRPPAAQLAGSVLVLRQYQHVDHGSRGGD